MSRLLRVQKKEVKKKRTLKISDPPDVGCRAALKRSYAAYVRICLEAETYAGSRHTRCIECLNSALIVP